MTKTDLINLFKQANKTPKFRLPAGYGHISKHQASKRGYKHIVRLSRGQTKQVIKKEENVT